MHASRRVFVRATALAMLALLAPDLAQALEPLPTVSRSAELPPGEGMGPTKKARLLFHWTTQATAAALQRGDIKFSPPGESAHGQWAGSGFYTADRFDRWTNDTQADALVVLQHDAQLRVIGREWLGKSRAFPTPAEAARLGVDGFEDDDQLVLYNSAHVRVLPESEAAPIIRAELRKITGGKTSWQNLKAVARIASRYLEPDEAARTILRALPEAITRKDRSRYIRRQTELALDMLLALPSRLALLHAARIALHPDEPQGSELLRAALARAPIHPQLAAARDQLAAIAGRIRGYQPPSMLMAPADMRADPHDEVFLRDLMEAEPALRGLLGEDAPRLVVAVQRARLRMTTYSLDRQRSFRGFALRKASTPGEVMAHLDRNDPESALDLRPHLKRVGAPPKLGRALAALKGYRFEEDFETPKDHGARMLRYQRGYDRLVASTGAHPTSTARR